MAQTTRCRRRHQTSSPGDRELMRQFRAVVAFASLVQSPYIISLFVVASALVQGLLAVSLSGLHQNNRPTIVIGPGWAAEQCRADNDDANGVCPQDSTCCPIYEEDGVPKPSSFACLPANKHISKAPGICCGRSLLHSQSFTGCPAGYRCAANFRIDGSIQEYCQKVDGETFASTETSTRTLDIPTPRPKQPRLGASGKMSPPYQSSSLTTKENDTCCTNETAANHPTTFPRYFLCNLPREDLEVVHGFPIRTSKSNSELAYYTDGGTSVLSLPQAQRMSIKAAVIAVHGSSRNADEYLCAASEAARLQTYLDPEHVLVVAPWFLAPSDGDVPPGFAPGREGGWPLHWEDNPRPIAHTWRYGGDAIEEPISSFDAIDELVEYFSDRSLFPSLERLAVIGHSAGGQVAHRYALLSSLHILDGLVDDLNFRAVAANPRSFTYLTALRHDSTSNAYLPPSREDTSDCTQWNEWPWGLDDGGSVTASYRDRAIELAGGVDELSRRYLSRNVRYLVGTGDTSILNGYCGDDLQGRCRRERARNYYGSLLQAKTFPVKHTLTEVDGSNHDHTWMFTSDKSLEAIFGDIEFEDDIARIDML